MSKVEEAMVASFSFASHCLLEALASVMVVVSELALKHKIQMVMGVEVLDHQMEDLVRPVLLLERS